MLAKMGILQDYAQFLSSGGLIPYAASGLDYLRGILFPDAPPTSPVGNPFAPPFTGGQCPNIFYTLDIFPKYNGISQPQIQAFVRGALGELQLNPNPSSGAPLLLQIPTGTGLITLNFLNNPPEAWDFSDISVVRTDGQPDLCGDMPNPNSPPPISNDGIAESDPPNFGDSAKNDPIVDGEPYSDDGNQFGNDAQDDFVEAGALAPTSIGGALAKLADGLLNLAKLLSLLNEILSLLKELIGKDNKSSFRYDFGSIEMDGFLRLFPDIPPDEIEALYIDISFKEIKAGAGKQFGNKSPNLYLYEPLGSIQFVSSSFGILSNHPLIASRNSIAVPPLAYGFFYRLGLDGVNKANASAFYLKIEKE